MADDGTTDEMRAAYATAIKQEDGTYALQTTGVGSSESQLAAGEAHVGQVGSSFIQPASNTIVRPTDTNTYAAGDLVANNTVAGSVTPFSWSNAARVAAGSGWIPRVKIAKSGSTLNNASFRVHFFNGVPSNPSGDNGGFSPNEYANFIGSFDVTVDRVFNGNWTVGYGYPTIGSEVNFKLSAGTTLYALLEARAAYVPGNAENFIITPDIFQN